jgi:hypothetical protein
MLNAALDWGIRRRMHGLSRSGQRHSKDGVLVGDVYRHFMAGIRAAAFGIEGERLTAAEAAVPWSRRLFFWEGYAFGSSGRHAVLGRAGNPLTRFPAPGFRFMFWTGLGFWNQAGKPFPRMSLDPARWADIARFDEEYPLILGGSAFAVSALTAAISKSRLEDIPGIRNAADLDGVYLGAGRSMWFLYTRNAEKLAEVLDAHPDHGQTMARGLGIAITLTQLDRPERIMPEIAALPATYWTELLGGVCMAFTCLLMDDARTARPLAKFPAPLDVLIANTHSNLPRYDGAGWTKRFEEAVRGHVAQWNGLQPPAAAIATREPAVAS